MKPETLFTPKVNGKAAQTESTPAAGLHTSPQALTSASAVTPVTPPPVNCNEQLEALQQSTARYRRLLEDQYDPICCFQLDFKITFINHAYSALYGKPHTELIGRSILELIPPDYQPAVIANLAALNTANPVSIAENPIQLPDGTMRWFQWVNRLIMDENGRAIEYQGVGRDITAHYQAEIAEREQRRLAEAILHNSPDAILLIQPDLCIKQCNAVFTALFGCYTNRSLLELIDPASASAVTALVQTVIDQQTSQRLEICAYQRDGTLLDVELSMGPVKAAGLVCILRNITERKQAQRALAEERTLLRTLIDAIPDVLYVKDRQHRFVLYNHPPVHSWPDADRQSYLGKTDFDFYPPAMAERFRAEEEAIFNTGTPRLRQEIELVRADGTVTWLWTTKVPLRNQQGEIIGLACISRDITQRKLDERQLRFYASLQENVSDAVIMTDLELRIQSWNRAAEIIYGWQAAEVIGQNLREVLQSDYEAADGHEATIQALLQAGSAQGEVIQRHRSGRRLSILRSLTLLKDEEGQPRGLVSVGRDMSERKEAERLLAEERTLLRTVIDAIPDIVFAKDRDYRFILHNSVLGYRGDVTPESCLGKTDADYFPPAAVAIFRAEDEAIFRTGQPLLHEERRVPRMDDIVEWASVTKVPLRNQQGEIIGLVGIIHDITARKEQDRQLRFYASLQENVSDAVITTDLDLHIQSWNHAAETIYGWRAAEVMGKKSSEILQTIYEATTNFEEVRQTLFQQGFWQGEVIQRHHNGRRLYILRSTTLLKDEQGVPFGFVAVNRNITERKEAERLLAEERNLLRTLIDAIPDPIFVKDRTHRFTLRNAARSHHQPDVNPAEWIGKSDLDHYTAPLAAKFWAEEEELFQTGQPLLNQELQFVRPDGGEVWTNMTKVPLRNLHGEISGLVGIIYDITAYKRALAALATSEEKYRHLIETMGSGFAIYDQDDNITYVNDRFCALLGYSSTELLGTSSYDYVDNANIPNLTDQLARRRQGEHSTYELVVKRKDGQPAHWLLAASPMYDEQGEIIGSFTVVTDITQQKKAEGVLQKALKKEQEVSELKSRFISTASHEFRTPLTSILLMTETLRIYRHKLTNEQVEQRFQRIQEQGLHLKTIMEEVLELASIQAGRSKFEPLPLALDELCHLVLEELQPTTEVPARLIYQCDSPIPLANFDKRLMRYVITNLVTNSLKYSPSSAPVLVRLAKQDAVLVLQVQDQGIGIPEADRPYLFQPFHRASNVGTIQGTGLGLVITKEAVELHGGTISVTSEVGVGTTFAISLPISVAP